MSHNPSRSGDDRSPEYVAAVAAHDAALALYYVARAAYHDMKIDDEEFLKARAEKVKADELFDRAFDLERDREQA